MPASEKELLLGDLAEAALQRAVPALAALRPAA
jgi:hypothetical protein